MTILLNEIGNRRKTSTLVFRTDKNLLIEVHPQTRIPRTFPRFAGLMVQLLHKYVVRAADGPVKLLKVTSWKKYKSGTILSVPFYKYNVQRI